jgi:hypothetical protein
MMIFAAAVIALSAIGAFLVYLWLRSSASGRARKGEPSLMPEAGMTISGGLPRGKESIHAFFQVEQRKDTKLVLHVLSELGNTPLLGIRSGAAGQLEVGAYYFPIQVLEARLPWLEVEAFPKEAQIVRRDSIRIPASFSVRFRLVGAAGGWQVAKGVNISASGLCFLTDPSSRPQLRRFYQIELSLTGPRGGGEKVALAGEAQWIQGARGHVLAGFYVAEAEKQRELARFVSRLQHRMARRPEDYLLEPGRKPILS